MYSFNRLVFELYKFVLNIINFIFFSTLILCVIFFVKHNKIIDSYINQNFGDSISSSYLMFFIILFFIIIYVSAYGLIATFININENLIQLNSNRNVNNEISNSNDKSIDFRAVGINKPAMYLVGVIALIVVLFLVVPGEQDDPGVSMLQSKNAAPESDGWYKFFETSSGVNTRNHLNVKSIRKYEKIYISYLIADKDHLDQQRVIGNCDERKKSNWGEAGWDRQFYSVYKDTDSDKELSAACYFAKKNGILK